MSENKELTERQKNVLEFIKAYLQLKGFAPSYVDIAGGIGLKSKSNICRIVHELHEKGYIKVSPYKFRSIKMGKPKDKTVNKMVKL